VGAQRSHRLDGAQPLTACPVSRKMRKPTLAQKWAKMAEEARAIAMRARNPVTKKTMLEIAASYDRLAKGSVDLPRRLSGRSKPISH